MQRTASSTTETATEGPLTTRSMRIASVALVVALVALAGVIVAGGALAETPAWSGESGTLGSYDDPGTASLEINETSRSVGETELAPGDTTTVEVVVTTEDSLGSAELFEIEEEFSPAFADVELLNMDPGGSGGAGPNNEELLAIWSTTNETYTLTYEVTVPSDATEGETFDISGTILTGDQEVALPDATITVGFPEETSVVLEPSEATANPNGQTTFDVVVQGADEGVGSYSINVSSSDVGVGEITNIEHTNTPDTDNSQIASDGSWGLVAADLGSNDHGSDFAVTVAQITVDTGSAGTSDFTIDSGASVSKSTGDAYAIDSVSGATLTVQETATFELSNLDPQTTTVNAGQTFDVSADVTNTGGQSGEQDVELSLEPGGSVVATQTVSLDVGETKTVSFQDQSVSQTGSYNHTVATNDDQLVGDLTVEEAPEPDFDVQNLAVDNVNSTENDGSTAVAGLDVLEVSATVENMGGSTVTQQVEFRLGGQARATKSVELDASETKTVSFTVTAPDEQAGQYQHGIHAGTANETTSIELLPAVSLLDAPARDTTGDGLLNDVNGDGTFDIVDVSAFLNNGDSVTEDTSDYFDYNGDGSINIVDVSRLLNILNE